MISRYILFYIITLYNSSFTFNYFILISFLALRPRARVRITGLNVPIGLKCGVSYRISQLSMYYPLRITDLSTMVIRAVLQSARDLRTTILYILFLLFVSSIYPQHAF